MGRFDTLVTIPLILSQKIEFALLTYFPFIGKEAQHARILMLP